MFWQKSGKSFFDSFEEHAAEIQKSALLLKQLFEPGHASIDIAKQIKDCEHRADSIIHQVINQMNLSGFILPLDREDIMYFIRALDDVIDNINGIAESYAEIYQLENSNQYAQQLADLIVKGSEGLTEICKLIRKPSTYSETILKRCSDIHQLEHEGDAVCKEALRSIFAQLRNNEIQLCDFIAWNDLFRTLEFVTDKIEDCTDEAEQMVLKYS